MTNPSLLVGQAFRFCLRCLIHIISFFSPTATASSGSSTATSTVRTPMPTPFLGGRVIRGTMSDPVIEAGVRKLLASIKIKSEGSRQEIFDDFLRQLDDEMEARALKTDMEGLLIWNATMDLVLERLEYSRNILEMTLRAPATAA